jgi:gluconate 2-dehydrogenase gamma chain
MNISRREFVVRASAMSAAWLAAAAACRDATPDAATHHPTPDAAVGPQTLVFLSAENAAELESIAARIFPTDDTPGAREAGVIFFIDQSLRTFATDQWPLLEAGLKDLANRVAAAHPGRTNFSSLSNEEQDELLRDIEQTEFFGSLRFATIAGMFALPKYGGNKDFMGWSLVNQEPVFEYTPPFGWYDRPENQQALLGRVL